MKSSRHVIVASTIQSDLVIKHYFDVTIDLFVFYTDEELFPTRYSCFENKRENEEEVEESQPKEEDEPPNTDKQAAVS